MVRNPLSLDRVDSAIARSAAGFGVAFLLQSVPVMAGQLPNMQRLWTVLAIVVLVSGLVFALVASIVGRGVRIGHGAFAVAYALVLITWPLAVIDPGASPRTSYWLYFLLTIATASATIGFGTRLATVYVVVVPAIYAVMRVLPEGGGVTPTRAVLDSVYAIILGGVISILIIVLRRAARAVDQASQMALRRYSHAVRQHAIEAERVQVDAIVHDSVLTTLLSAARSETPEAKALAATMASNAIGHLRDAAAVPPDSGGSIGVGVVASRIVEAVGTMSRPFAVHTGTTGESSVPLAVAEAVYSAAVQAMVNSLQHAGDDTRRWVRIDGTDEGIEVEIGDDGPGFDVHAVPTERLGVRVSIIERVSSAGGRADVDSEPGRGTRVRLRWPDPDADATRDQLGDRVDQEAGA